jgi:hypothetical protein
MELKCVEIAPKNSKEDIIFLAAATSLAGLATRLARKGRAECADGNRCLLTIPYSQNDAG